MYSARGAGSPAISSSRARTAASPIAWTLCRTVVNGGSVKVAVPFCTWMLKGYFDTIPVEIDEAGRVDGLGPYGTFWRLILPLARPGLAVTAFYTFLTAWGEVAYASAFLNTNDKFTLAYGLQTFVPKSPALPLWELLTPAAVLITIPSAIVFFFAQKHLVAGLTAGGTKG